MQKNLFHHDGLVLRHESLHDEPADEVSHGTNAEDNHIAGGLTAEAKGVERGLLDFSTVLF